MIRIVAVAFCITLALARAAGAQVALPLKLDRAVGPDLTVVATVPTFCDIGMYSIHWGDGLSERMFPPPLAASIDCSTYGPFSQAHRHLYAAPGTYPVVLTGGDNGTVLGRLSITIR